MQHELQVVADPDAVAGTAAAFVARLARTCVQAHGRFTFAVSGGHTPWAVFARLYPALARAQQVLWFITGADKREPLSRLVAGDRSIPAGRVEAAASLVLADTAAGQVPARAGAQPPA
ncbi:6-phosphogluconolactonase [Streptomyces mirabilis]|uniref:6-phosphogluconolactonase n=1 Tax=Streptomyces mirabilis TaxID=68239 RepID=UPI0036B0538C